MAAVRDQVKPDTADGNRAMPGISVIRQEDRVRLLRWPATGDPSGRGTGRGTAAREIPVQSALPVRSAVSSVQVMPSVRGSMPLVMRSRFLTDARVLACMRHCGTSSIVCCQVSQGEYDQGTAADVSAPERVMPALACDI